VAALVMAASAVLFLASGVQAYVGRTLLPWGLRLSPGPVLLFLIAVLGGVYLLVMPRLSLWFRVAGIGAFLVLLQGIGWWVAAAGEARWPMSPPERRVECLSHVKQLTEGLRMYADRYEVFPAPEQWEEAATAQVHGKTNAEKALHCPEVGERSVSYGYNGALAGVRPDALATPEQVPLVFESDAGWNAAGGPELLPKKPRHFGGDNYGFADGSVRWVPREKAKDLIWEPVLKGEEGMPQRDTDERR